VKLDDLEATYASNAEINNAKANNNNNNYYYYYCIITISTVITLLFSIIIIIIFNIIFHLRTKDHGVKLSYLSCHWFLGYYDFPPVLSCN
jgi:hypothetical protein